MDGRPGNRSRGAAGRLFRLSRNVAGVGNSYGRTRLFLCDPFATLESQLAIQPSLSPVATLFSLACRFRIRSFDVVVKAARRSNPSGATAAEASGEPNHVELERQNHQPFALGGPDCRRPTLPLRGVDEVHNARSEIAAGAGRAAHRVHSLHRYL